MKWHWMTISVPKDAIVVQKLTETRLSEILMGEGVIRQRRDAGGRGRKRRRR
jgi:hypothetical protein